MAAYSIKLENNVNVQKGRNNWIGTVKKDNNSFIEAIGQEKKQYVINEINNQLKKFNVSFEKDNVIWEVTQDRLLSETDLINKFNEVK